MRVSTPIIRVLLGREILRMRKNPSALLLVGLLVALALLLAASRPKNQLQQTNRVVPCWIVYSQDGPWIADLKASLPEGLPVRIISQDKVPRSGNNFRYPAGHSAIELLPQRSSNQFHIRYLYSGKDPNVLAPILMWFWPTTTEYFGNTPQFTQEVIPLQKTNPAADLANDSVSELMTTELVGTMLLCMVQFFTCCHLLVSFSSQDRERGTLTALALTPANTAEILIAKYIFHLTISLSASALILGILKPAALSQPVLWCVIALTGLSLMSVGTTIASLAKTQVTASFLTLCYMLVGGTVFYLGSRFSIFGYLTKATFEHYSFMLIFANMKYNFGILLLPSFMALTFLTAIWLSIATAVFHRRGWQ